MDDCLFKESNFLLKHDLVVDFLQNDLFAPPIHFGLELFIGNPSHALLSCCKTSAFNISRVKFFIKKNGN